MRKILVSVLIVFLLCLGLTPVLAGPTPCVAATSNPVVKITLAPFVHVKDSNVTNLYDGIGYADSVLTIDNGSITGTYTNTTEIHNTDFTNRALKYISFYGSSRITINNTTMPSTKLYVYDFSQVTIINSTLDYVEAYGSSEVTIKNNSTIVYLGVYDDSRAYVDNSNLVIISIEKNSRVYINNYTKVLMTMISDNSYLNAINCTMDWLYASGFSTGQITNNCTVDTFTSYDAADFSVDNSTINNIEYGLVCTGGSLTINGNTITSSKPYRYTATLTNGNYDPTPSLVSVGALASSTVNITNNNTITRVFAAGSSQVYLENDTQIGKNNIICTEYSNTVFKNSRQNTSISISCHDYSSLTIQNVTTAEMSVIGLNMYDQSSATIENIDNATDLTFSASDQSELNVKNLNLTTHHIFVTSRGSSVVDIVNVTTTTGTANFVGYDLSVMTINSSNITNVIYAVKSDGNFSVTNDVLNGDYVNLTTWNNPKSLPTSVKLWSIAVVGTDNLNITDSTIPNYVYLHDNANLITQNSDFGTINAYDSSTVSGMNTSFNLDMFDQSSASVSNITANLYVYDSATLTCNGNESAPTSIQYVVVESNYPQMANVTINNCTVKYIQGETWIPPAPAPAPDYTLPLLLIPLYSSSQSQQFTLTLLAIGGATATVVAVAAWYLWRRRA